MRLLIKNIKELVQVENEPAKMVCGREMKFIDSINDAYLVIEEGIIYDFGKMADLPSYLESGVAGNKEKSGNSEVIDATGKFVFPSFCDPHTHLVFAGSREHEFTDKINGLPYEEIARRGGGILNSARKLHETSEDELFRQSMVRVNEIISQGTGAAEIKSGYGLNTADELKMLRVIDRIRRSSPLEVRSTFLGAHALPAEFSNNREGYIDLIINEMIPLVAAGELADFIDVFCDKGFFTEDETERILMAGIKYGLIPRLHANQLDFSGGVQVAVKYNALSADHLEHTGEEEIRALLSSETVPVLLPGSSFFLGMPDPPARKMIDSGLPVALASDYNPGSSPSGNMKLVMSLACIRLKMMPAEALNAATINAACAMGLSDTHGSIARGKAGNVFITSEIPSLDYFPYAFGSDLIDKVILRGKLINK
ncbi:MAG: imidazolonepropionase [Bacteroidales bacterium]